ncbi:MAG TPA: Mrp/NBP35 family ATP-binding protein [Acidobacteriota bacterium]|nr:Mrp/NBP35 family ATP-binding protein [Acidobacteriota bacterium]
MLSEEQQQLAARQDELIAANIRQAKRRIVVFSGKGGVGKTTVAVNLAYGLHLQGRAIGILDADITGPDVPKMLGLTGRVQIDKEHIVPHEREGIKIVSMASMIPPGQPVIWRGPMRSKMLQELLGYVAWGPLDYLVADLPPGTGDEVMTLAQKMKPHLAIIVTTPQDLSLIDSRRAINMAREMNIPRVALIENMSGLICPQCGHKIEPFGSGGGGRQAAEMAIPFLGSLPMDVRTRELADQGQPIIHEGAETEIAIALTAIIERVEHMMDNMIATPESAAAK